MVSDPAAPPSGVGTPNPNWQTNKVVGHATMPIVVGAGEDSFVSVFDLRSGRCVHRFKGHQGPVTALCLDGADGDTIFTGGNDGAVRVWSLRQRKCVHDIAVSRRLHACVCLKLCKEGYVWRDGGRGAELAG